MVPKSRRRVSDGRAAAGMSLEPRMQQGQKVRVQSSRLIWLNNNNINNNANGECRNDRIGFRRFSGVKWVIIYNDVYLFLIRIHHVGLKFW